MIDPTVTPERFVIEEDGRIAVHVHQVVRDLGGNVISEGMEEELAWIGANLSELRRSVYEQRTRYWTLWIGFVVGPSRKRPDVSGQRSADRKLAPG